MNFRKKLLFSILGLFLLLVALELGLNVLTWISPRIDFVLSNRPQLVIDDEALGIRPNPAHPEHDRKGFRNRSVPEEVSIVAMGDSQTYGEWVAPREAWPRRLAAFADRSVYSMAYGGYGPAHHYLLFDEALDFAPALVIEAFYAGNDLFDSFKLVHLRGQAVELTTADSDVLERIAMAENADPLEEKAVLLSQTLHQPDDRAPRGPVREFLAEHSMIYAVARRAKRLASEGSRSKVPAGENWGRVKQAASNFSYNQIFEHGASSSIFSSEYRALGVDLDDPRIAQGHRISMEAIRLMNQKAMAQGAQFLVLLIPTKEFVYKDVVSQRKEFSSEAYDTLIASEERMWALTKSRLEEEGIRFIDALAPLRHSLKQGRPPYPQSWDGHLNATGHRAVADFIATRLLAPD